MFSVWPVVYGLPLQLKDLEAELNQDWQEKSDRLLKNAQERHDREMANVKEESKAMEEKLKALEAKVSWNIF